MDPKFFEPLIPHSIRLLKLSVDHEASLISFNLHVVSLDENIEYTALSYTWGDPIDNSEPMDGQDQEEIMDAVPLLRIDGNYNSITPNLRDALSYLVRSGYQERFFWIDAICINQADSKEKGIQVSMMGEIYSKANNVIAWFGKDTTDWTNFERLHYQVLPAIEAYLDKYGLEDLKQQDPNDPTFSARLGINPVGGSLAPHWKKYFRFGRRRKWWTRAWIAQEVALARNIIIQCGWHTISWLMTAKLLLRLVQLNWIPLVAPEELQYDHETRGIRNLVNRLRAVKYLAVHYPEIGGHDSKMGNAFLNSSTNISKIPTNWYVGLQTLLYNTRSSRATDARDKVYANLGIASKALPPNVTLPMELQPNYSNTMTAELTYSSTAKLLLTQIPRLATLSYIDEKENRKLNTLPSWVPDYSTSLMPVPLITLGSFNCWPSDTPKLPSVKFFGSVLEVQGACLDEVKTVCAPMREINRTNDINSIFALVEELDPIYKITGQGKMEALWRTMIANTMNKKIAPAEIDHCFKEWAREKVSRCLETSNLAIAAILDADASTLEREKESQHVRQLLRMLDSSDISNLDFILAEKENLNGWNLKPSTSQHSTVGILHKEKNKSTGKGGVMDRASHAFSILLNEASSFRRIYITRKGYLGIGPESMKVGDEVWMLETAAVPFVLRKKEGHDEMMLVGESYLHGFMQGERFEEFRENIVDAKLV